MAKNVKKLSLLTKIIISFSIIIALFSIYIIIVVDLPNKPTAGKGSHIHLTDEIGGQFTLIDQNGNQFDSKSLEGKMSLVYFGFTYCPDICPASLQKLTNVVNTLSRYNIDVTPIFITIDPERDNCKLLKSYLEHFHSKFVGLTGSKEDVRKVANLYKVYYAKANNKDPRNYMMDHSSFIYLMDKNGKYIKHFCYDSTVEEIVEFIRINR